MDYYAMISQGIASYFGSQASRVEARLHNRLQEVGKDASMKVRRARNTETMAKNSMLRYAQSLNNNKVLDDGGAAFTAHTVNTLRRVDYEKNQAIVQDINQIEQAGAQAASQAFNGVGGNVVDMVNSSTLLRASIIGEMAKQRQESFVSDQALRASSIYSQMIGGMDGSVIFDALDYQQDYTQERTVLGWQASVIREISPYSGDVTKSYAQEATNVMKDWFSSKPQTQTQQVGLATRERSSNPYDIADFAYDNNIKLGETTNANEMFSLGNKGRANFGFNTSGANYSI